MPEDRGQQARREALASQRARAEEVGKLPPELRDRLRADLLDATGYLDERRKFFGDVAVVLGSLIAYNALSTREELGDG